MDEGCTRMACPPTGTGLNRQSSAHPFINKEEHES